MCACQPVHAEEYTNHREAFNSNARKWTDLYARPGSPEPSTSLSQSRSHGRSPVPPSSLTRRMSQQLIRARSLSVEVDSPALSTHKEYKENIEPEPEKSFIGENSDRHSQRCVPHSLPSSDPPDRSRLFGESRLVDHDDSARCLDAFLGFLLHTNLPRMLWRGLWRRSEKGD
jgi:hypothetical protein